MKLIKINIGSKSYICDLIESEEDKKLGLMNVDNLPIDRGALFVWEEEDTREMWMKNTKIPLDLIAINEDDEVVLVYKAQPEDETLVPFMNAKYILEVNQDSGIVEGDDFEIDDSEDLDKYVMKVLAPNGSTQMYLLGGERIVSRKETKTLIRKAKKANENKGKDYEKHCKALGKYMFKVIKGLDTRPPEYVQVPEDNLDDSNDRN